MSEAPICIHCHQPIDTAHETVIPNKDTAGSERDWRYAHLACQMNQMKTSRHENDDTRLEGERR